MKIIKRILGNNKRSWDSKLNLALWEDRIIVKKTTSESPFELVYGSKVRMPLHNFFLV